MSSTTFAFDRNCDELGPEKIVHLYDPHTGLRGSVVVDNTACGPAIGGVRMAEDVSVDEVFRRQREALQWGLTLSFSMNKTGVITHSLP